MWTISERMLGKKRIAKAKVTPRPPFPPTKVWQKEKEKEGKKEGEEKKEEERRKRGGGRGGGGH